MSDKRKDLSDKIIDWLDEQGYPLEMVVAREFQRAQFRVFQSEYYDDPETGTSREVDVIASLQKDIGGALLRISFCMECKSSGDKPWVMFTSEKVPLAPPARVVQRAASSIGTLFLHSLGQDKEIQSLDYFGLPQRSGYGITQAFTSGRDIPYEATISAAKCASAKVLRIDEANRRQGPLAEIAFPIVIIDARLFESYLDENDEVVVEEIDTGILVWRNSVVQIPHTIVRISTLQDLSKLIQEAKQLANSLFRREKEMESVVKAFREAKLQEFQAHPAQE